MKPRERTIAECFEPGSAMSTTLCSGGIYRIYPELNDKGLDGWYISNGVNIIGPYAKKVIAFWARESK